MHALEINHFSKSYGKTIAVDNLNLTIESGEFFGLLGHNGAGKTTTIHCITGIGQFTKGSIGVFGKDVVADYQETRQMIGLSAQEFNIDIFMPLEKTLDYMGGYFGMKKIERTARITELLTQLDLTAHAKKPFGQLSGGLKRRAILARALMHHPNLLILDEPTAGIDVEQRRALWSYLERFHQSGRTIILTSHYLEEVERLCTRVAIMHQGKIAKILKKEEFRQNGKSLEDIYLEVTGMTAEKS